MSEAQTYTRFFTVEEANALIPRLRPKVEELLTTFKEIRTEIETAASQAGLSPGSPELARHLEARAVAPGLFDRVKRLIGELHDQGCLVNGPEAGLVDFPCVYNNETVFLCWKYGEPRVGYWHRIPDGFAGRRPLLDVSGPEEETRVH
ncbi:MAG TPA: DUF2203 domain-containing protein [Candidatus Binatia bacterium]|nr:DUF2203 domain-containing protein [Candidatus Binatia bacterium]